MDGKGAVMPTALEQARLLLGYNEWANERVLRAADDLSPARFDELLGQFAHMLGTQRWWHARWTHGSYGGDIVPRTYQELLAAYSASHTDLRAFADALTDEGLDHSETWWGDERELSVGELIVQVVNHSTQHRSEIAVAMSTHGSSPGDLDYLFYRVPLRTTN